VTGGAGFVGSCFVRNFIDNSLEGIKRITIIDKLTYAGSLSNLSNLPMDRLDFYQGDICDSKVVRNLLFDIDAVVNFAAESHVDRSISNSNDFIQTNIVGVQVLLDAIHSSGRDIRFLQVSTDEVYGSIQEGSWKEDMPLQPNSPYSASKACGELLTRAANKTHALDIVITRSSNNYGPYQFPEKLIPKFIAYLLEGKKLSIYGSGTNIRDWIHVDDHCNGIYEVLMKGKSGSIYNIGGGTELTNLELTRLLLDIFAADESVIEYVQDRKGHDFRYSLDWTKINQELGYEPRIEFKEGLRSTVQWYRDNKEWWKPRMTHY
jgi:dTDP-glucose 4,6-dehydratase